jgi:hypothetical protein
VPHLVDVGLPHDLLDLEAVHTGVDGVPELLEGGIDDELLGGHDAFVVGEPAQGVHCAPLALRGLLEVGMLTERHEGDRVVERFGVVLLGSGDLVHVGADRGPPGPGRREPPQCTGTDMVRGFLDRDQLTVSFVLSARSSAGFGRRCGLDDPVAVGAERSADVGSAPDRRSGGMRNGPPRRFRPGGRQPRGRKVRACQELRRVRAEVNSASAPNR